MRRLLASAAALALLAAPSLAEAFCGFYVAPTDAPLVNDATRVALMRRGTKTVLSMSNTYQGPLEDFAMVVPVPVVLKKEEVRTLPHDLFDKLETLTAPRLVEYWEQDPCGPDDAFGFGGLGLTGIGFGGGGIGYGAGKGGAVKIEARFAVGEYEVVVLSAEESDALERWLHDNEYKIPKGAATALAPYVKEQWKFFVAKVDAKKVKRDEKGKAILSPLRFHYESTELRLPVRLGLLNSSGAQDLIVFLLGERRYEAANYPNVFVPTNLDVADETRKVFRGFYAQLFDATLAKAGGKAVVTEYAWPPTSCDPCPGPNVTLTRIDELTLGADVTASGAVAASTEAQVDGSLPPAVVQRILRANAPRFRACHLKALGAAPGLKGTVSSTFTIDATGAVKDVKTTKGTLESDEVARCVSGVLATVSFPEPASGEVKVTHPLEFPIPGGFGPGEQLVVTRLHTRYSPDTLGEDLVFRAADPVVGGREIRNEKGVIEHGAVTSAANAFQARYAIRHPWTGPIACEKPVRGRWGGPPPGADAGASADAVAALGLADVPRGGGPSLAALVKGGLDDAAGWDLLAKSAPAAKSAPKAASAAKKRFARGPGRACHCTITGHDDGGSSAPLAALGLVAAVLARRRRA